MGRKVRRFLLLGLLAVPVAAAAAVFFRQDLLAYLIQDQLARRGATVNDLTVDQVSLDKITLGPLSLGDTGELQAQRVEISYQPQELLDGRVASVTIAGLRLRIDLTGEGPPLGSLQDLIPAEDGAPDSGVPAMPIVQLEQGHLDLQTTLGAFTADLSGALQPGPGGAAAATLNLSASGPPGRMSGRLKATRDSSGALAGDLVIDDGGVKLPTAQIDGLEGQLSFEIIDGLPQRVTGELLLSDVALPDSGITGAVFQKAQLTLGIDPERASLRGDLLASDGGLSIVLDGKVDNYLAEPTLALSLETEAKAESYVWRLLGLPQPAAGVSRLNLKGTGTLPALQTVAEDSLFDSLKSSNLKGDLTLRLDGITYADRFSNLSGSVDVETTLQNSRFEAKLTDRASFTAASLDETWLTSLGLPGEVARQLLEKASLSLAADGDHATSLRLRPLQDDTKFVLRTEMTAAVDKAEATLSTLMEGKFDSARRLAFFDAKDFALSVEDIAAAGLDIDRASFRGPFRGTPKGLSGNFGVTARLARLRAGPLDARKVALALPLEVRLGEKSAHIKLRAAAPVTIGRLMPLDAVLVKGPIALDVTESQVDLDFSVLEALQSKHMIALKIKPLRLLMDREDSAPLEMRLTPGRLRLDGELDADGRHKGTGNIINAGLLLPEPQFKLEKIKAKLDLSDIAKGRIATFTVGRLSHLAPAPRFVPLSLSGQIRRNRDNFQATAKGGGPPGAETLRFDGNHSLKSGFGHLQFDVGPLNFIPGGLQPGGLLPDLALLEQVSGSTTVGGVINWTKEGISSNGLVSFDNLGMAFEGTSVKGLNLALRFSDLLPPQSPPDQILTIDRIDSAVPLEKLTLRFRLEPGDPPIIAVADGSLSLIGGRISVGPTRVDPLARRHDLTVRVDDLDLETLFDLIQVDGLSGNGRLDGQLPISLEGSLISLRDGALATDAPGLLRFKSEQASELLAGGGDQVALLLQALEEFHYEELTLALEKSASDELVATLSLLGNNPNVLEGRQFRLNINLESNIGKLLEAFGQGYRLSNEALRRAFRLQ